MKMAIVNKKSITSIEFKVLEKKTYKIVVSLLGSPLAINVGVVIFVQARHTILTISAILNDMPI